MYALCGIRLQLPLDSHFCKLRCFFLLVQFAGCVHRRWRLHCQQLAFVITVVSYTTVYVLKMLLLLCCPCVNAWCSLFNEISSRTCIISFAFHAVSQLPAINQLMILFDVGDPKAGYGALCKLLSFVLQQAKGYKKGGYEFSLCLVPLYL